MNGACQSCNKAKATVHITDTMPEKRERHLCESCAEREGVIIKQTPQTTSAILQEFIKQKVERGGDDQACPKCGMTFKEFRLKGQLGCPHDYEAFRELLTPMIERAHQGATQHVGKVPATADIEVKKEAGLYKLRRELQEALQQERYEQAASLRDEIRTLETPELS